MECGIRQWRRGACAAMAVWAAGVWAAEEGRVVPIYPTEHAIEADGKITDWEWAPTMGLAEFAWTVSVEEVGPVAQYWLRYDQQFLYLAARITDDSPAIIRHVKSQRWMGDQFELLICTDPTNHAQHAKFTEYDYQLFIGPDREGQVNCYVNQNTLRRDYVLPGAVVGLEKRQDGKGYDLEAKLPWASLHRAESFQVKPGTEMGFLIQLDFGQKERDDQHLLSVKSHVSDLHYGVPKNWAWARLMPPNQMLYPPVAEVKKASKPAGSAQVRFETKQDGLVSLNVMGENDVLVRRLLVGETLKAGQHEVAWDGLDEAGKPAKRGMYRFVGLVANLDARYVATMGNSSPEPYGGLRRSAGGEYRHGACWTDVVMNEDGTFHITNDGGEGPPSVQLIDPAKDFAVIWAGITGEAANDYQSAGARDGTSLYFLHPYGGMKDGKRTVGYSLSRWDPATHRPRPFKDGRLMAVVAESAPDEEREIIRGLAAGGGRVYVPLSKANRVDVWDAEAGAKVASITNATFDAPSDVWVRPDGSLLVVDRKRVYRLAADGSPAGAPFGELVEGYSLCEDAKGSVYVSDAGSHQVKVYDAAGKLARAIGPEGGALRKAGARPFFVMNVHAGGKRYKLMDEYLGGPVRDDAFFQPRAVAVDGQGNLVVLDAGNQRIQCFGADGKLRKSIIATHYSSLLVDPAHPNPVFVSGGGILREYELNYETGEHRLTKQYGPTPSDGFGVQFVRWLEGKPYFMTTGGTVFTIEKDRVRICGCYAGYGAWPVYEDGALKEASDPARKIAWWTWRDANGDGLPGKDELNLLAKDQIPANTAGGGGHELKFRDNWDVEFPRDNRIVRLPFGGFDKAGNPMYDRTRARVEFSLPDVDPCFTNDLSGGAPKRAEVSGFVRRDDGQVFLVLNDRSAFRPDDTKFRAYSPQGVRRWSFGNMTKGFWDKPGTEFSFVMQMLPPLDDFIFVPQTYGPAQVFTDQGLYAGVLLWGGDWPPEKQGDPRYWPQGECWWAHLFRNKETGKVYLIAQPNAAPLTLLYEVQGLDKVERFGGECRLKRWWLW